jgi:DNA polymerase I-like protein with 3'-5' exonuclease and polymerase domains/uracil-DNA glycosylase
MSQNSDELVFLPRAKFLRQRPVMLITDCPLDLEVKNKSPFSSTSASSLFSELNRVGVTRGHIHATYLFSFRPEKGDIAALFHRDGLPQSEYVHWPNSKKDWIINYGYNELLTLREEIKTVEPSLIICAGRWSLYFLFGEDISFRETKKSPFGTLLKWRASHLQLNNWWDYQREHVLIPILPPNSAWQIPDKAAVIKQDLTRLSFVGRAAIAGNITPYVKREENFITQPTFEQVKNWLLTELTTLDNSEVFRKYAIDVETRDGYHDCIGIAKSATEAICIPWSTTQIPFYWTEQQEVELGWLLRQFLLHPKVQHIGQNYSYDMQYLWRDLLIIIFPHHDTMVMQHTMFAGMEKDLAFLASLYCTVYKYWKDEGATHKGRSDLERWIYNCRDCCTTFEICEVLESIYLEAPPQLRAAYEFQVGELVPALVEIMNRGVRTDINKKSELYHELRGLMAKVEGELQEMLAEPFNPKSTDQKKALFYDLMELPVQYDPKTNQPTLNAEALDILKEIEPLCRPFADRVQEYGNLNTFSSTFLKAEVDEDGRMRTSYNPCGTDTFRLASRKNAFGSGMNLQNVPHGGETALGYKLPNVRALFLPDPGMEFFDIDLDSADLRIVVAESGATDLQRMFEEGLKPYIEMMKEYYHDPSKNKNSPEYKTFKAIAHGTNYIGSASGLAVRTGLLVHDVDRLQKWYFSRNPEIKEWHKELKKQIDKRGWIENIFGYRRYFFNKQEKTLYQIGAAWKPQSTVGILINRGMVNIRHNLKDVQVLLQVHDSLAGQYPIAKPYLKEEIKRQCSIELPYPKPIVIPVDINTSVESWGGCK